MKKLLFAAALGLFIMTACSDDVEPILDVSATELNVGYAGETVTVDVNSNYNWTISPVAGYDWCTVTTNDSNIQFNVEANEGSEPREASYEISTIGLSKTIKISQKVFTIPDNYENLSEYGTSNCYIVIPESKAYFDATVKGSTTEPVGDVASAKLIWQSEKSLVTYVKYVPANKAIAIELGEGEGNALVAALNSNGEVLWSWHLWITYYSPEATLFSTPANASGTVWQFMDRNLGAMSNTPEGFDSHGLIYQWGRKDPFPSAVSYTDQDPYTYEYIDGKDGEPAWYDIQNQELPKFNLKAAKNGTDELAVKNPDVFYLNLKIDTGEKDEYGDPVYDQGDWRKPSNDDAWGGISMKKTVNDPCPVGYKVPVCDADGNTPYAWLQYAKMTWDKVNYGATQDYQWFPATGTRVYEGGGLDFPDPANGGNPYSGLWIGTIGKGSEVSHYGQYMFIINGKRTFKVNKDSRSQGMSLRCVAE